MTRPQPFVIGFAVAIFALSAGLYSGYGRLHAPLPGVTKIDPASIDRLFASQLHDSEGKMVSLASWRGKTVVVNFWATWCPPCREEMPGFSRLQRKYATNSVQFVGIALDNSENVRSFLTQFNVDYPLLIGDTEGADLARKLGDSQLALPYTLVIAPNGEVRFAQLGAISEQALDSQLKQIPEFSRF